jgi:hypothetical protein
MRSNREEAVVLETAYSGFAEFTDVHTVPLVMLAGLAHRQWTEPGECAFKSRTSMRALVFKAYTRAPLPPDLATGRNLDRVPSIARSLEQRSHRRSLTR